MVWSQVRLCCLLYLMVVTPLVVKGAPEEFPTSRRLFPSKQGDSQFESSNGGVSFSIFRPFWRRGTEKEETEEREMTLDEEKEIWTAVMDHAGDEVSTEKPAEVSTEEASVQTLPTTDVTVATVTPSQDEEPETSSTVVVDTSREISLETAADAGGSSEGTSSEIPLTTTVKDVEMDPESETSEASMSDMLIEDEDESVTSVKLVLDEPTVTETEELSKSTEQAEDSDSSKTSEESIVSKRVQEPSVTREADPQTVELMSSSQRPHVDDAEADSTPTENKDSHHIGHNLKVVTWTLGGVCLSVVIIGNFLGIYFSYIKPRMHHSTLL